MNEEENKIVAENAMMIVCGYAFISILLPIVS